MVGLRNRAVEKQAPRAHAAVGLAPAVVRAALSISSPVLSTVPPIAIRGPPDPATGCTSNRSHLIARSVTSTRSAP
jgi:hypothetical protein